MITIKNLTGQADTTAPAWTEHRGILQTLLDNPVRGFARHVSLGSAGILISRGPNIMVGIPMSEIFKLAEKLEPGLVPPTPDPATAKVIAITATPPITPAKKA